MGRRRRQPGDAQIEWADYDRVQPGEYSAYCRSGSQYFDRGYKRWVCILRFDLLAPNKVDVVARVQMWLSLGDGKRPRAARRGRFFQEWVRANGGPPVRGDRLSVRVFIRRMARVVVGDTNGPSGAYSVVQKVLDWETGCNESISQ
jgi:hypothetical protein